MADLKALTATNAQRWAKARSTRDATLSAKRLVAAKSRYQAVSIKTGVPWFVIAVIHERESSQNWASSLAQGDPFNKVSVHVPAGRGPFPSWEDAAIDALVDCPPRAARWTDWSAGGALTLLEQYNGLGYAGGPAPTRGPNAGRKFPPQASPYVWSGTDQYTQGKYVADKDFRSEVVDKQLGCAVLLKAMMVLDPTITFTGLKITTTTISTATPSITNPAKGSIGEAIAKLFLAIASIFKRRS